MNLLDELAERTIAHPSADPTPLAVLEARVRSRRGRRRALVASFLTAVALGFAAGLVIVASNGGRSVRTPPRTTSPPRPSVISIPASMPTATMPLGSPSVPPPTPPRAQRSVPWAYERAPLAEAAGRLWVGTASGIAIVDPETLNQLAEIATGLPAVAVDGTGDAVWLLSGSTNYPPAETPNYILTKFDPASGEIRSEIEIPIASSAGANRNVRLSAFSDAAWVALGDQLWRVDATTGAARKVDLDGAAVGHLAADRSGLWIATSGSTNRSTPAALLHVAIDGSRVETIDGVGNGHTWGVATTGDSAWLAHAVANEGEPSLVVTRIDAVTREIDTVRLPAVGVVASEGRVWIVAAGDGRTISDPNGNVVEIDPTTGEMKRTVTIGIPSIAGSEGYVSSPFAVAGDTFWTVDDRLQRTDL